MKPLPEFANSVKLPPAARVRDDWLTLEVELVPPLLDLRRFDHAAEDLLLWNGIFQGPAKFILTHELRVRLAAQLPWNDERADESMADTLDADCRQAQDLWCRRIPPPAPDCVEGPFEAPPALLDACAASGWTAITHPGRPASVSLDLPGAHAQAHLLSRPGRGILVATELAGLDDATPLARAAVAVLLLLAGAVVRRARPAIRIIENRRVALFEVVLPEYPDSQDIDDALSSLSLVSRMCAREVEALMQEPVARDYLAVMPSLPFSTPNPQ